MNKLAAMIQKDIMPYCNINIVVYSKTSYISIYLECSIVNILHEGCLVVLLISV